MSVYTPTTEGIREAVADSLGPCITGPEFDAWLAQERAQVEAAVRAHLARQLTAKAAHSRSPMAAFTFQQAARIARGEDQ